MSLVLAGPAWGAATISLSGAERIVGTPRADSFTGGPGAETLLAGAGDLETLAKKKLDARRHVSAPVARAGRRRHRERPPPAAPLDREG